MYLAALWDARKPKDSLSSSKSEEIRTFTVLTTESCEQISWLHDRMPLILTKEQAEKWLDCDKYSFKECESFIHSYKGKLIWHAVSQKVNSVKNDDPECVLPLDEVKEKQKASGIGKFFSKSQNVDSSSEHVFEKNVSTPKKEVKLCQDSKSAGKLRTSSSTQAAKRQRSITQFFKTK